MGDTTFQGVRVNDQKWSMNVNDGLALVHNGIDGDQELSVFHSGYVTILSHVNGS